MKVAHIWEIPDQGGMLGGNLYDKYGNLDYFADTTALTDKQASGVDKQITRSAHTRNAYMRDKAPVNVASNVAFVSYFSTTPKGALPGYTITLVSDAGLPGQQKRDFQYTGTLSGLGAWLKTTAKMLVDVYGPTGSHNASIPAATP